MSEETEDEHEGHEHEWEAVAVAGSDLAEMSRQIVQAMEIAGIGGGKKESDGYIIPLALLATAIAQIKGGGFHFDKTSVVEMFAELWDSCVPSKIPGKN